VAGKFPELNFSNQPIQREDDVFFSGAEYPLAVAGFDIFCHSAENVIKFDVMIH
jgi:hypothetical protein